MNTSPKYRRSLLCVSFYELRQITRRVSCAAIGLPLALTACVSTGPTVGSERPATVVAKQWHAALPHGGKVNDLKQWWSQFDDPLMPHLIEQAQLASPTIAQAAANIADAQASRVASGAPLLPSLGMAASAERGRSELGASVGNVSSLSLETSWELDLFGANRAGLAASEAQLASRRAQWHDARVTVAADVAKNYIELRACEAQIQQAQVDAVSRTQTSRITELAAVAGIRSPATADLARASAAQGASALEERKAACDLLLKALVALTAYEESMLRHELVAQTARLPQPTEFGVNIVPAEVLTQRPDIHAAARDVIVASATSTQASAQRWPRITLAGNIGATRMSSVGVSSDGTVWGIGPVAITFPLFDGGTRQANAEAARVRYDTATKVYAGRLRTAIQEVEGSLVKLASTARRGESASAAAKGFESSYKATAALYDVGAASLFELEDARRSVVSAQSTLIDLRRDRLLAWVSLYRAMGGGWSPSRADTQSAAPELAAVSIQGSNLVPLPDDAGRSQDVRQ